MSDSKPRILIVDDEPDLRELLTDALGQDVDVTAAASGAEALRVAQRQNVDLLVTDLCLGDCTGLDVIDRLRTLWPNVPAVVITGHTEAANISETSRRRPLDVLSKPLDLGRLRATINQELTRQADEQRKGRRASRLRKLARHFNVKRRNAGREMENTCADLTDGYQKLSRQLSIQKQAMQFNNALLSARNDDDVFKSLFAMFVTHSGPLFGAALVCDPDAQLQLVGRFGVPLPDPAPFCMNLANPMIDAILATPRVTLIDAGEHVEQFDAACRKFLVGLTILAIPLMPTEGEVIGMVLLYRKGEQPFMESDLALAELISTSTALAVQRND